MRTTSILALTATACLLLCSCVKHELVTTYDKQVREVPLITGTRTTQEGNMAVKENYSLEIDIITSCPLSLEGILYVDDLPVTGNLVNLKVTVREIKVTQYSHGQEKEFLPSAFQNLLYPTNSIADWEDIPKGIASAAEKLCEDIPLQVKSGDELKVTATFNIAMHDDHLYKGCFSKDVIVERTVRYQDGQDAIPVILPIYLTSVTFDVVDIQREQGMDFQVTP